MDITKSTISFVQVLSLADKFYNSIEQAFRNTLKYRTKADQIKRTRWEHFLDIAMLAMVFSVLPLLPFLIFLLMQKLNAEIIDIRKYDFYIWWGFCVIMVYPMSKFAKYCFRKDIHFKNTNHLRENLMVFCYLYKSIKEIELYIENNFLLHLETARHYLEIYFNKSDKNISISFRSESKNKVIIKQSYEIVQLLKDYYKWFKLDEVTEKIISTFKETSDKIIRRIKERTDLDIIIGPLKLLAVYEYSKVKTIPLKLMNSSLEDFQRNCLLLYSTELSSISDFKVSQTEVKSKKIIFIIRWLENLLSLLTSDKVYVLFLSWFIILEIIVVLSTKFLVNRYNIPMDSTIIGVVIGVPIASATAIVSLISSKKNKKNVQDNDSN